jgi:hypothetical protein
MAALLATFRVMKAVAMDSKPTTAPIRKIAEKPFAGIDDYKRTTDKFVNIDESIPDGVPLQARWKHAESKNEFIGTPHPFDDYSPEAPPNESQPTCFGKCFAHPDQIVGSAQEVRVCVLLRVLISLCAAASCA